MAEIIKRSVDLLPAFFRTDANAKFLDGTIDQFIQEPSLKRLDAYIGSKSVVNYNPAKDNYINGGNTTREQYELEPALVIKDSVKNKIESVRGYEDVLNSIGYFGASTTDQNSMWEQQMYSWNPHIDYDKFVNFNQYVWVPNGPDSIEITGPQQKIITTYKVKVETDSNGSYFVFSPDGVSYNPQLTLFRNITYIFDIDAPGHKFLLKTRRTGGTAANVLTQGVINNGIESGVVTIEVTDATPSTIFYVSSEDSSMFGKVLIRDIQPTTELDVEKEILGKKSYIIKDNIGLTNGMRVAFSGNVIPETYQDKTYIVEGVGDAIKLIDFEKLITPEKYAGTLDINFDLNTFDEVPFDSASSFPVNPEYVTINRASIDANQWSRYNRWFHIDTIEAVAKLQGVQPNIPYDARATRPIIEFVPNIQLQNFGKKAKEPIAFLDTVVTDAFSRVEGSSGFYIDGVALEDHDRIIFVNDPDPMVRNKIYEVQFIYDNLTKQIHLEPAVDFNPAETDSILITKGTNLRGSTFHYENGEWVLSQEKTAINQFPKFAMFDNDGVSYNNPTKYPLSNFNGSTLFQYKVGTGVTDTVLGFPLVYRNVANVGDFLFENTMFSDTFTYKGDLALLDQTVKSGFIKINNPAGTSQYENGWTKSYRKSSQQIVEQVIAQGGEVTLEIKSISADTTQSAIKVYKNGVKLTNGSEYLVYADTLNNEIFINFLTTLVQNDVIRFEAPPEYTIKSTEFGRYETPANLTNNPLNEFPVESSFAEINDHVITVMLNHPNFVGNVNGSNNLRDLSGTTKYGTRFVQHEGLAVLSNLFVANEEYNLIHSLKWVSFEYNRFKQNLLNQFNSIDANETISGALDRILTELAKGKESTSVFYYSDMTPYGVVNTEINYTVSNTAITSYAIGTVPFNPTVVGSESVLVYINNQQVLLGTDYTFDQFDPVVTFKNTLTAGDKISIKKYTSTNGLCMPPTPSKLGLYPKFEPKIVIDSSYVTPTKVIVGHDGSRMVAFNDARDDILLELEKRIYNNIKSNYDALIFDINEIIPGAFRQNTDVDNFNGILREEFLRWAGLYNVDYITNDTVDSTNAFTYNYSSSVDKLYNKPVPGFWRGIYRFFYDTATPNETPWQMLGFYVKPDWWDATYGEAPYTAGNTTLWDDLENGYIRSGANKGFNPIYARPGLSRCIPVDTRGVLRDPLQSNLIKDFTINDSTNDWKFGDNAPAETAWKRSSFYPFALQIAFALLNPAKYLTLCFDTSRNKFNLFDQVVYSETNQRINPKDLVVATTTDSNGNTVYGSGYHVYAVEWQRLKDVSSAQMLADKLDKINVNLFYKVGGFTSKDSFKISIDTVTSSKSALSVFVPNENYDILFNKSTPIKSYSISGVIVQRGEVGYKVLGYDNVKPYFTINPPVHRSGDGSVTIGGTTEKFIYWSSGTNINAGTVVQFSGKYYRAKATHQTGSSLDTALFYPLPFLPTVGGVTVNKATLFDDTDIQIPYGTVFQTVQEVYDVIQGYGAYLEKQGFIFDHVLTDSNQIANWDLSSKEFLLWTLQTWTDNAVISLAPFSSRLKFKSTTAIVDNVLDSFYEYSLLKSDGRVLPSTNIAITREDSTFTINTDDVGNEGVYFARLHLVQKEHAVVIDNKTIFNDIIYDPVTGYRQLRIKINGFVTDNWDGDYFVPGFIYDDAKIEQWQPNTDYHIGDVVRHQGKYYEANKNLTATDAFDSGVWALLSSGPAAEIYPNFEYKIQQFEDFYSLDSVNFDKEQQRFAQKLIGYTPRTYLNAIIPDETSQYKFYQGYIKEKGTIAPLEKFAVASNKALGSQISLGEDWAFRVGLFGGQNFLEEIEFTLNEDEVIKDPQAFEFTTGRQLENLNASILLNPERVLIKPLSYDGSPWPIIEVDANNEFSYQPHEKLPTAGYVRLDDVDFTAVYENNLPTLQNNSALVEGDTVWTAIDRKNDWDVKRYSLNAARIIDYVPDNDANFINFKTDHVHNLSVREYISIAKLADTTLNIVYEVVGIVDPYTFTVVAPTEDVADPELPINGSLYEFRSVRFKTFDELNTAGGLARFGDCEFVWVDNDGTGRWAVYEHERSVDATLLRPYEEEAQQQYGAEISVGPVSKVIAVAASMQDKGRVYLYRRSAKGMPEILQSYAFEENPSDLLSNQTQLFSSNTYDRLHGESLSIWENDDLTKRYIVSGAPGTTNAKWDVLGSTTIPVRKEITFNNGVSGLVREGALKIVKFNPVTQVFETDVVLGSPYAEDDGYFGSSVKFVGKDSPYLLVSSPGGDSGVGEVYAFFVDSNNDWQVYPNTTAPFKLRSKTGLQFNQDSRFGESIVTDQYGDVLVVSAPGFKKDVTSVHNGAVFVFKRSAVGFDYDLAQTIYADDLIVPSDLLLKGVVKTYASTQNLVFAGTGKTLTRRIGNWLEDGFRTSQKILVSGTASNNGVYKIESISNLQMTLQPVGTHEITDETVNALTTITGLGTERDDKFGDSLALSGDGSVLAIGADHSSVTRLDSGAVYIFDLVNGQYEIDQTIDSPSIKSGELFGNTLSISTSGTTLMIGAIGGDDTYPVSFDRFSATIADSEAIYGSPYVADPASPLRTVRTVFDGGSTAFVNRSMKSGVVYLYERKNDKFIYGEVLSSQDTGNNDNYGYSVFNDGDTYYVGSPLKNVKIEGGELADAGTVVIFDKKEEHPLSWTQVRGQDDPVDAERIKKVLTYDSKTLELVEYYEIFDPIKGLLPKNVMNEIKYMTPYDPATYTVAVEAGSKVRVDNKTTWLDDHIGELWLDLSTLRYVWYEQGSIDFRNNNWGKLFPGCTVDVYEWVKSDLTPSQWAAIADTEEGLARGISGQPKFPNNSVVSVQQYFDPLINDFSNVYCFWVRNKVTLPSLDFRTLSAYECAKIIEDPKTQGIKYACFLSPNAISLGNLTNRLNGNDINCSVQYELIDANVERHSQWQLINEKAAYLNVDPLLERKMIDSLVGQDTLGNPVPDESLSPKLRYGTQIRPRQSWFVDRFAALKTVIDYTNTILRKEPFVGMINLDRLNESDTKPVSGTGVFDLNVSNYSDLLNLRTSGLRTATLSVALTNGRLTSVEIIDGGLGYVEPPKVIIEGTGVGAEIETVLDSLGRVTKARIISQGSGYTRTPIVRVRPYTVLVDYDEQIGKWAMYELVSNGEFERSYSQTFNVATFWNYVDWTKDDYNPNKGIKFNLAEIQDLQLITNIVEGDYVSVSNEGDGRKIVLEYTTGLGNYIQNYNLAFRERGTIQFDSKIYDYAKIGIGFDTISRFDQNPFDEKPVIETRKVLEAIQEDIFINDRAHYWSDLFFTTIRYVLGEQLFVDWVFKTSLITPTVNAGNLSQDNIYRFNNFGYVEEFIKEIKPYRTKIKDFITLYDNIELAQLTLTDFDKPPYLDKTDGTVKIIDNPAVLQSMSPYKEWDNNKSFYVKSINVARPGSGYYLPPLVNIISAPGDTGSGAEAKAYISGGSITRIVVTNPGSGYTKTPTVLITGGGNYGGSIVPATAYAVLENGKVRSNKISLLFDRTATAGTYGGEAFEDTFVTDGKKIYFTLTYPAVNDLDTIEVFVNEGLLPNSNYRVIFRDDLTSIIAFDSALFAGQSIRVTYLRNSLYTVDTFSQASDNRALLDTFKLTFVPELDKQKITVKINGTVILSSNYILQIATDDTATYHKKLGYIKLKDAPAANSVISVEYAKGIDIQNAVDRIINYYSPVDGMPGRNSNQLMKGVDFGGVEIQGLDFSISVGWDGLPWFSHGWDTYATTNNDFSTVSDGVTTEYDLGYVPVENTAINVYYNGVRVDDPYYGTLSPLEQEFATESALLTQYEQDLVDENNNFDALSVSYRTAQRNVAVTEDLLNQALTDNPVDPILVAQLQQDLATYQAEVIAVGNTLVASGDLITSLNTQVGEQKAVVTDVQIRMNLMPRIETALFVTPKTDGISGLVRLPTAPASGIKVTLRTEFSDGVLLPTDESVLDTYLDGGNLDLYFDGTVGKFSTAGGLKADDINLDGGQFLDPAYSHGPEELVMGEVFDSVAINVFNGPGVGSVLIKTFRFTGDGTTDTYNLGKAVLSSHDQITVTVGDKAKIPVNERDITAPYDFTVDQNNDSTSITFVTPPAASEQILVHIYDIGGEAILARFVHIVSKEEAASNTIAIETAVNITDVGSFYVSANGQVLKDNLINKNGATKIEAIAPSSRASVILTNGILQLTEGTAVTVVVFKSEIKTYSELYYQNIEVTGGDRFYTLSRPPGTIEPAHTMAVVIKDGQRLRPAETEYFVISQNGQSFFINNNVPYKARELSNNDVEVYLNGKIKKGTRDYKFDNITNKITFRSGVTQIGDAVAVSILKHAEYLIVGDKIQLKAVNDGDNVSVITYTNHDKNLIRRETFIGNVNGTFPLSRAVTNIDYIWVDINGKSLTPNLDYGLDDDGKLLRLNSKYVLSNPNPDTGVEQNLDLITPDDKIVVTTISEVISGEPIGYKQFKDLTNKTYYKRLGIEDSTYLVEPLGQNDVSIYVNDTSIFGHIDPKSNKPGVVFIAGERIEFFAINGNALTRLTRGTLGTGIKESYAVGTRLYNAGAKQNVPYTDGMILQTEKTTTNEASITLNKFKFVDGIPYTDQCYVYYGGQMLQKPGQGSNLVIKHNPAITYDSNEVNSSGISGDYTADPEFYINKVGTNYILTLNSSVYLRDSLDNVVPGVEIKVVQKIGKTWYTLGNDVTLQNETTPQALFLQTSPAVLPDKYYYGNVASTQLPTVPLVTEDDANVLILENAEVVMKVAESSNGQNIKLASIDGDLEAFASNIRRIAIGMRVNGNSTIVTTSTVGANYTVTVSQPVVVTVGDTITFTKLNDEIIIGTN